MGGVVLKLRLDLLLFSPFVGTELLLCLYLCFNGEERASEKHFRKTGKGGCESEKTVRKGEQRAGEKERHGRSAVTQNATLKKIKQAGEGRMDTKFWQEKRVFTFKKTTWNLEVPPQF